MSLLNEWADVLLNVDWKEAGVRFVADCPICKQHGLAVRQGVHPVPIVACSSNACHKGEILKCLPNNGLGSKISTSTPTAPTSTRPAPVTDAFTSGFASPKSSSAAAPPPKAPAPSTASAVRPAPVRSPASTAASGSKESSPGPSIGSRSVSTDAPAGYETSPSDEIRRVPPNNLEAEQSVLGSILIQNQSIETVKRILVAEDFYYEKHRHLFRVIGSLHADGLPIDAVTVNALLKQGNRLQEVGGEGYVAELALVTPTAAHIEHYANIVKSLSIKRDRAAKYYHLASLALNGVSSEALLGEEERILRQPEHYQPSVPLVEVYDLPQLYKVIDEYDRQPWIWDGILPPSSLSLIVGKSETGKSTLVYSLMYSIITGNAFLGRKCIQGRVLYLAGDPSSEIVAGKLFRELGINDDVIVMRGALVSHPQGLSFLREQIAKYRPVLVVADTLAATVRLDTDSYGKSYESQQPLSQIAREFKPNLLMCHHSQKTAMENYSVIDAALGSVGVAAVASTRMATRMYRRKGERFYTFEMSNLRIGRPLEGEMLIKKLNTGLVDKGGMWRQASMTIIKEQIIAALTKNGDMTKRTLQQSLRPKPNWGEFEDALEELFAEVQLHKARRAGKGGGEIFRLGPKPDADPAPAPKRGNKPAQDDLSFT